MFAFYYLVLFRRKKADGTIGFSISELLPKPQVKVVGNKKEGGQEASY
jgi:hypothetical protein